jgi:hypothetical protein
MAGTYIVTAERSAQYTHLLVYKNIHFVGRTYRAANTLRLGYKGSQYLKLRAVEIIVWLNEYCACSNEWKSLARVSYESPEYHISGVMNVEKRIFFYVKSCVLQRSKFIVVSFLHFESWFGSKRQRYTALLSRWKSVLRVNDNILSLVSLKSLCLT